MNPIDVNLHLKKKNFEAFDKDSADKIQSKKNKTGDKSALSHVKLRLELKATSLEKIYILWKFPNSIHMIVE